MAMSPVKFIVKRLGKGVSTVLLALAGLGFTTYAFRHFPFWGSALSFLLMVCCFVPMILHFNLFPDSGSSGPKKYQLRMDDDELFERRAEDRLFDDD
ncbi:hypothetical protein ACYSUW_14955 [Pseudomonas frederiksbergensis]